MSIFCVDHKSHWQISIFVIFGDGFIISFISFFLNQFFNHRPIIDPSETAPLSGPPAGPRSLRGLNVIVANWLVIDHQTMDDKSYRRKLMTYSMKIGKTLIKVYNITCFHLFSWWHTGNTHEKNLRVDPHSGDFKSAAHPIPKNGVLEQSSLSPPCFRSFRRVSIWTTPKNSGKGRS